MELLFYFVLLCHAAATMGGSALLLLVCLEDEEICKILKLKRTAHIAIGLHNFLPVNSKISKVESRKSSNFRKIDKFSCEAHYCTTTSSKMGCDGGSIPRREELVKLKKKAEKVDPTEVERIKWFTCAMSNERLKEPIVACELGHLYNKEAVIRALIEKNVDEKFSHIRSLKVLLLFKLINNNLIIITSKTNPTFQVYYSVLPLIEVRYIYE